MRLRTDGDDFLWRHCGAQYAVSYTELPIADSGSVYREVCRRQMIQWNSCQEPSYKLVKRPDLTALQLLNKQSRNWAHSAKAGGGFDLTPAPLGGSRRFLSIPTRLRAVRVSGPR
jgi:hypothetical protein